MEILEILTKVRERKAKKETEVKKKPHPSKQRTVRGYIIGGDELIQEKLKAIIPKLHKDVRPLLVDRTDIVKYNESSNQLYIEFEDKSSMTIKFGADNQNHYTYIIDGTTVINDYA